jgi:hypothetical protein
LAQRYGGESTHLRLDLLALEFKGGGVRLANVARLTEEKPILVESIDSEVISYVQGIASLAVID